MEGEQRHAKALRGEFGDDLTAEESESHDAWAQLIAGERRVAMGEALDLGAEPMVEGPGAGRLALFRQRYGLVQMSAMPGVPPPGDTASTLAEAWAALTMGGSIGDLEPCAKDARRLGLADLVVEAHALLALDALRASDGSAAVRQARLASRMARTESIPSAEYLAGIVLARTRRAGGFPHLATQILHALAATAPPIWRRWIRWELALSGAELPPTTDNGDPAVAILAACRAAKDGNLGELHEHLDRCAQCLRGVSLFRSDLDAVSRALLSGTDDTGISGENESTPPATPFAALVGEGHVVCTPERGVSVRSAALPLWPFKLLESAAPKQKRSATLVAVLALAGGELKESECFAQVYGFAFQRQMHRGSFDVLLHRVRAWLEGNATLEREGDRIRLRVTHPFIVHDPREGESVEARILRIVANGSGTARAAAAATGLSVRQAQSILKVLAEDGACIAERRGPGLHYRVEDTTFSEPTRV